MKRTTEMFLSITGVLLFGLLALGNGVLWMTVQDSAGTEELVQQFLNDENITDVSVGQVVDFLSYGTVYLLVISVICTVLGVIAVSFLKGNKKPAIAGKMLLTTAILGTLLTIIIGILGGIAYLAAGIIAISKKETTV